MTTTPEGLPQAPEPGLDIIGQLDSIRCSHLPETLLKISTHPCVFNCHKVIVAERIYPGKTKRPVI